MLSLLVAAAAPLPFLPCVDGPFVSDDLRFVARNAANLSHAAAPWTYVADASTNATPPDPDIYRPLRTWSYALDHALFGGGPRAAHVHSLLLHAAVSGSVAAWLLATVGSPAAALVSALLFAWHPLTTEAVCWVSSRADLQCALFALIALLAARRLERLGGAPRLAGSTAALAALLAGLGKESGAAVPLLHPIDRSARGLTPFGAWRATAWIAAGTAAYLALYVAFSARTLEGQVPFYEGSYIRHLGYALLGWARLLGKVVWPTDLLPLWEPHLFQPLDGTRVALAFASLAAFFGGAWFLGKRIPALRAGVLFFAVALLPAGNVIWPMRTVLAERFAYLPLAGLALALAGVLASPAAARRRLALLALALAPVLFTLTARRAADWGDAQRLYESAIAAEPESYFGRLGLGGILLERGLARGNAGRAELEKAAVHLERALEIAGGDRARAERAALALARTLCALGGERRLERAVSLVEPLLVRATADPAHARTCPDCSEVPFVAAYAFVRLRRASEAERWFERWRDTVGPSARLLDGLAETLRLRHDGRCVDVWREAIALDPNYVPARVHLARVLADIPSMRAEARRQLREALARRPDDEEARALLRRLAGAPVRR